MQTRLHSFLESLSNIAIGYAIALGSQMIIFPAYGIEVTIGEHAMIGFWFTAVSLIRSYALRRWFNHRTVKGA